MVSKRRQGRASVTLPRSIGTSSEPNVVTSMCDGSNHVMNQLVLTTLSSLEAIILIYSVLIPPYIPVLFGLELALH